MLKACYGDVVNNTQTIIEKKYKKDFNCFCILSPCLAYEKKVDEKNEVNCNNTFGIYNEKSNITKCENVAICSENNQKKFTPFAISLKTLELFCNSLKFYNRKNELDKSINVSYNITNTQKITPTLTKTIFENSTICHITPVLNVETVTIECPCKETTNIVFSSVKKGEVTPATVCGINTTNVNNVFNQLSNASLHKCLSEQTPQILNTTPRTTQKSQSDQTLLLIVSSSVGMFFIAFLVPLFIYLYITRE